MISRTVQQLTIAKATSQARRIVNRVMPGAMATVESRHSWDAATDRQTVVTTITFPAGQGGYLFAKLSRLGGQAELFPARIVITRTAA